MTEPTESQMEALEQMYEKYVEQAHEAVIGVRERGPHYADLLKEAQGIAPDMVVDDLKEALDVVRNQMRLILLDTMEMLP